MVDICICANGKDCNKCKSCYRFLAEPEEYQAVADFYEPNKECQWYWKVDNEEQVQELNKKL